MLYIKEEPVCHHKFSGSSSNSTELYYYALCFKPPKHRYQRYSDGTPILDDNWHFIKNNERDYGFAALTQGWTRIYRLLTRHSEILKRCFAREKGWTPKSFDSFQSWKENEFRNRKRFYTRVNGMGRWHGHALLSSPTPLDTAALKRKILEILGSKNYYNVDLAPVRNLKAYIRYIEKNARETVRPRGQKHIRLLAKSLQNRKKKGELFLTKNSSQLLQPQGIAGSQGQSAFIAIYSSCNLYILSKSVLSSGRSPPS